MRVPVGGPEDGDDTESEDEDTELREAPFVISASGQALHGGRERLDTNIEPVAYDSLPEDLFEMMVDAFPSRKYVISHHWMGKLRLQPSM